MRFSCCTVGLLVAFAGTTAASAQTVSEECGSATEATMPPNAGPYMTDMNTRDPMSGQMKRDDMLMGDVAKSATQKEKCMSDPLKLEEKMMDGRKQ
jgi:hypothetical protein